MYTQLTVHQSDSMREKCVYRTSKCYAAPFKGSCQNPYSNPIKGKLLSLYQQGCGQMEAPVLYHGFKRKLVVICQDPGMGNASCVAFATDRLSPTNIN